MNKIVNFEEIADCFLEHGTPVYMFINKQDSQVLANILPTYYIENQCNVVFATGHLGSFKDVPVLPGSIGKMKAKLCWN